MPRIKKSKKASFLRNEELLNSFNHFYNETDCYISCLDETTRYLINNYIDNDSLIRFEYDAFTKDIYISSYIAQLIILRNLSTIPQYEFERVYKANYVEEFKKTAVGTYIELEKQLKNLKEPDGKVILEKLETIKKKAHELYNQCFKELCSVIYHLIPEDVLYELIIKQIENIKYINPDCFESCADFSNINDLITDNLSSVLKVNECLLED